MDLVTLALAKKYAEAAVEEIDPSSYTEIVPSIGENGNWFIKGKDTGISAIPQKPEVENSVLKLY